MDLRWGRCSREGAGWNGLCQRFIGDPVSNNWHSWLQPFMTLLTTEAEFVVAVEAGKAIK